MEISDISEIIEENNEDVQKELEDQGNYSGLNLNNVLREKS
jgi:hypothetical protein